jgi:hypothetical protein
MAKQLRNLFFIIYIFVLASCTTNINFNEYIDKNLPLELIIQKNYFSTDKTMPERIVIPSNSDKFIKLTQWAENNTTGWEKTPASYVSEVYVRQGDFRLLYTSGTDGVVIGFTDRENNPKQYSKKIKKGELDFLIR